MRYITSCPQTKTVATGVGPAPIEWLVESLERRKMLAGQVAVMVTPVGDILITGDQQGNDLVISRNGTDLVITGNAGTQISLNGTLAAQQMVDLGVDEAVDRDLKIRMRGGEDRVEMIDFVVSRHLDIDLGLNDDRFITNLVTIQGQTKARAGAGRYRDLIVFGADTILDESVMVWTGPNRAGLSENVNFAFCTANDRITVVGGSGAQSVNFEGVLNGPVKVSTGSGNDSASFQLMTLTAPFFANLGSGDDRVSLQDATVQAPFESRLGTGNDQVVLSGLTVEDTVWFGGGAGIDTATFGMGNAFNVPISMSSIEEIATL